MFKERSLFQLVQQNLFYKYKSALTSCMVTNEFLLLLVMLRKIMCSKIFEGKRGCDGEIIICEKKIVKITQSPNGQLVREA